MNLSQTVMMAIKSILNNKVRSILTMLGIIIGVGSVIALVATIQGQQKLSKMQYDAMGSNRIDVYSYGISKRARSDMEEYIEKDLGQYILGYTPVSNYRDWTNKGIKYRTKELKVDDTQVYFANQNYGLCNSSVIAAGRDITEEDCKNEKKVCVIGEAVRKTFFGAMSPLEQKIKIGGTVFEVVGVYQGKYGGKLHTDDQMILIPYTLQERMMGSADIERYVVRGKDSDSVQPFVDALKAYMSTRVNQNNGYFDCYSNNQWQEQEQAQANQLSIIVGGVAGISLLVGGIGIMNIMLVSVTERTREIGIRMAIGARRKDIIGQFLIEAAVVSCCGGILGIILGCFGSAILGNLLLKEQLSSGWMPDVGTFIVLPSPVLILGSFLFSALLGIIFGLYPANKASKLQPVDALRMQ